MKVKAKKINCHCNYLTEDRVYDAFEAKGMKFGKGGFVIIDDFGDRGASNFKNSAHICGDWTIITEPTKVRRL